eukprot:2442445-Ditylum_brightwellii.AAC.2
MSYTKFEGRYKSLKGYIFDLDTRNMDRFVIFQQKIARYIGADFEHRDLIVEAIRTLQIPQLDHLKDPGETTDRMMEEIFKESIKDYVRETRTLKQDIKKAYNARNIILLLRAIKMITHRFDHCEDQYLAVANDIRWFWNLYQDRDMSNQMFFKKFKAIVAVVEDNGGNIALHPALIALKCMLVEGDDDAELTEEQEEEIKKISSKKFLA